MRQSGQNNRLPRIILWIVCGLCLAATAWRFQNFGQEDGQTAAVTPVDSQARTRVHALGRLEPAGTVLQLAPDSGNEGAVVAQLLVNEGDDVEAGAVLAVLDNRNRRAATFAEAKAGLESANAKLLQTKAGAKPGDIEAQQATVLLAEAQARVAARELERAKELHQREAMSDEQLVLKQWDYDRTVLEQRRQSGLLRSIREVRETDVMVAEMDVAAAKTAMDSAEAELRTSELRATSNGRILKIHVHPGERIGDLGLLEMGDVQHMQAVAEVFEADVALLEVGMLAEVLVDGSGDRISGSVCNIGNLVARKVVLTNDPVSDTDARVVEVRIQLDPQQMERLARLSNARVEVFIELDHQRPESSQVTIRGPR